MDVDVTTCAASSDVPPVGGVLEGGRRMTALVMALLAKPRGAHPQQSDVVTPMRHVAVPAIFADRWMLVKERPPFVHMATVTVLVDAVLRDQLLGDRAMNIVAIRALKFPLPDRHVGPILEHRGLDRVTFATKLKLGRNL
jgi:hypothetical protein